MERVIPFLLSVAKQLEEEGKIKGHEVVGAAGKTESARKKFEDRDSGKAVDGWASAFADASNLTVFDYWRLVIDAAEAFTLSESESQERLEEARAESARHRKELMRVLAARNGQSPSSD